MDKKIRVRFSKREGTYTLDYSRVADQSSARRDILRKLSADHELLVVINTGIDMYQSTAKSGKGSTLDESQTSEAAADFLKTAGLEFCLKKGKKEFSRTLIGFPAGKPETRRITILAIALGKGQLDQAFFNALGHSHDLMIGIDPARPVKELLDEFENGQTDTIEAQDFAFTLIDSQWLGYFYTNIEPSALG